MRNLYKYVLVVPLAFCAIACGRYEYHNQSKFAALNQGSILLQQPVLADGQIVPLEYTAKVKNRTLGGFSFTPSGVDKNGRPHDPVMFSLRREKQSIQAETVLFESKNKAKTFFDTSTIEIGADRKNKQLGFELTFQF